MKIKYSKITLLAIALISLTSCNQDFLELTPEKYQNTKTFYKTEDDFNAATISCYSKLQSQVDYYFELSDWRSDYLDLAAPTSGTQDRYNINKFQETSANGIISEAWANYFNGIFRCNMVINQIPNATFNEEKTKQFEAEAKFIRALTYFNIVRIWGDAPIISKPLSTKESLKSGRKPIKDVYSFIEEDLNYAIKNLPNSYPDNEIGRATSNAAKTLLGKVYLTEHKYAEAETTLKQVLNVYQLQNEVSDVFSTDNKNNSEIIFAIRFDKDISGEGHGLWFSLTDTSNSDITDKIMNAYESKDKRLPLIQYQRSGSKFAPGKFIDSQSKSTKSYGNDFIVLRYSDVLLMLSEAMAMQEKIDNNTLSYLNKVRERAGIDAYDISEINTKDKMMEAILKERFLEFPLEGQRWFDLIRTNTAQQEIKSGINISIQPYQKLYPVPQGEIEKVNNPSIFYQNEGY